MTRSPVLALLALCTLAGCAIEPRTPVETAVDEAPRATPQVEEQVTVAAADGVAPPEHGAGLDPVPFQIGAGYGALSRVDLGACRERGLPSGYVRVRATFTRVGYVVRASVETATPPPAPALDCIADRLRQTGVPAFDGKDARLSKTYFVEPGIAETTTDSD